jgi:small subunit ribosomal protein S21
MEGGEQSMVTVELKPGESQESLLRRFRKKVHRSRILSEAKRKRFYMSESEKRRIAQRKAERRQRRRLARNRRDRGFA